MHATAAQIQALLHAQGVPSEVIEFAASTKTAADAAAALGTTPAQICKSIVFNLEGAALLVMTSGSNRVDVAKLAALLGATPQKADAAFVRAQTGYAIGGVPPLGHAQPVRLLLDRDLLQYAVVYAAAGTPNTVFPIAPAELQRITGAEVVDCRVEG